MKKGKADLAVEKSDTPLRTKRAPYSYAPLPRNVYCGTCYKRAYYKVTRKLQFIDKVEYYCKSCYNKMDRAEA